MNYSEIAENTGYKWGVDEFVVNMLFIPIIESRGYFNENFSEQFLNLSLQKLKFAWHTAEILLLNKLKIAKNEDKDEINKYIDIINELFDEANAIKQAPLVANKYLMQQTQIANINKLQNLVNDLDAWIMRAISISGLWLRENWDIDPGQAIREKFKY